MSEIRNTILQLPDDALKRIFDGTTSATFGRTYLPQFAESAVRRELRWMRENPSNFPELARFIVQENAPKPATAPTEKLQIATFSDPPEWAKSPPPPQFNLPSPTVTVPVCTDWLRLTGDFALISDLHIPFHHAPTIERFLSHAYREGLRRCIVIGDSYDFNQFNRKRGHLHQRKAQDDIQEGKPVWKAFLDCFEEVKIIPGNHDDWLGDFMRKHFDMDFLMSKFHAELGPRLHWSNYGQADVESGGKRWKLLHGANYSGANPLGVAKGYCSQYLANVVMGHQHHAEDGRDVSGQFQAVVLGGAYDADRMAYLHYQPRKGPRPTRSYALLKDGYCLHIKDV